MHEDTRDPTDREAGISTITFAVEINFTRPGPVKVSGTSRAVNRTGQDAGKPPMNPAMADGIV
jgi:hypothetical protein